MTITIPVGASAADSDPFAVRADDAYAQGADALTVSISSTAGGNFEALDTSDTASTAITEDADATAVTLTATESVVEGGAITYTASLTAPVTGSVVLVTLNNGQVIEIPVGSSSASVEVPAPGDDPYVDAGSVSAAITAVSGGNFENLTFNGAAASTAVTDDEDTSTVSLTASESVAEGGQITYTAHLTAPVTGTAVLVTLDNGQMIEIALGASSGSVNYAVPDDVFDDADSISAAITAVSGGNYENLIFDPALATTELVDAFDVPAMDHAISNIVLYLQEDDGHIYKVKIDDFSEAGQEYFDADDDLNLAGFIDVYADGDTLVALTVKAGNNGGQYGPGEGELFILDNDIEAENLPLQDHVPESLTYDFVDVAGALVGGNEPSPATAPPDGDGSSGGDTLAGGALGTEDADIDWGSLVEESKGTSWVQTLELNPEAHDKLVAGDWTLIVDGEAVDPSHLPSKLEDADVQITTSDGAEIESFQGVDKIEWGNESGT